MPSMFYSMSWDALVASQFIEDPTLLAPMKLNSSGTLSIRDQFIEETRSYSGNSVKMALTSTGLLYTNLFIELSTPTSSIPTPDIPAPIGSMSFDTFDYYTPSTPLIGLNSGSNEWNNTTILAAWNAKNAFLGIKNSDIFNSYASGSIISGSAGGTIWDGTVWSQSWDGRYIANGILAYDNFTTYNSGSLLSGSNGYPDNRYLAFTNPWDGRTGTNY